MIEVSNLCCKDCKYSGDKCKCIDHSKVHFARSCFSCDKYTGFHMPCSAFEPVDYFPQIVKEWNEVGGFENWHKLFIEQWHNGKMPKTIGIIMTKPREEGREDVDDIWDVPYEDFLKCNIIKDNKINYVSYRHIERSRKSVTGYQWIRESEGVLDLNNI